MTHLVSSISFPNFPLWEKIKSKRSLLSFELEITARCNNNCRHCYINVPARDKAARQKELSFEEIKTLTDEAVSLGALWCLITGGEPLLRKDFIDIYLYLKSKGLLVSVFTNATLVAGEHVRLFQKHPPRDIEVTVYGVKRATYERVTRKPGSFTAFMAGLNRLIGGGVKVRLKAMALRSNVAELPEIARFCRARTRDYFRFDPFLHLRFDRDPVKNNDIKSERLTPDEIVTLETSDQRRYESLQNECDKLILPESSRVANYHDYIFGCGAGYGSFTVSYDGRFRLCSSLCHPACVYDLRKGSLFDALHDFVPKVRAMRSNRSAFLESCRVCPLINLCMFCPAHAHLESGEMDLPVEYFCEVAHARADKIKT